MARPNLRPRRKPSKAPFPFLALPTELRLQIYNYLFPVLSYSYMHTDLPRLRPHPRRRRYPLRRHGMLLANRQLHAEYAQAFYERTMFFFYVDANNGKWPTTVPFWALPPALLPNLRQCQLCVDLGVLTRVPGFLMEAFIARIEALLGRMERVQWVYLVWNLWGMMGRPEIGLPLWERKEEEWFQKEELWERLGERFVQRLKGGAEMRWIIVKVGRRMLMFKRKGAEWVVLRG
ncbi:hypothetical protein V2W45_1457333 [Cenococcum geophilum]